MARLMESMRIKMKLYRKRRNLVISVIFPDLHALPPDLHHEMLRKLLQHSFVMIVVKHIFSSFIYIFVPVFLVIIMIKEARRCQC